MEALRALDRTFRAPPDTQELVFPSGSDASSSEEEDDARPHKRRPRALALSSDEDEEDARPRKRHRTPEPASEEEEDDDEEPPPGVVREEDLDEADLAPTPRSDEEDSDDPDARDGVPEAEEVDHAEALAEERKVAAATAAAARAARGGGDGGDDDLEPDGPAFVYTAFREQQFDDSKEDPSPDPDWCFLCSVREGAQHGHAGSSDMRALGTLITENHHQVDIKRFTAMVQDFYNARLRPRLPPPYTNRPWYRRVIQAHVEQHAPTERSDLDLVTGVIRNCLILLSGRIQMVNPHDSTDITVDERNLKHAMSLMDRLVRFNTRRTAVDKTKSSSGATGSSGVAGGAAAGGGGGARRRTRAGGS